MNIGPLTVALREEIVTALQAYNWPVLDPTMESVMSGPVVAPPEVENCGGRVPPDTALCTWGSPAARTRSVLVGNSTGMVYAAPLREIALNSGDAFQLHTEAAAGCNFVSELITNDDAGIVQACTGRKQRAVDFINATKPEIVIISNSYAPKIAHETGQRLSPTEWSSSMRQIIDQFRQSVGKIVFLSPPPTDIDIRECYSRRTSTPVNCITQVSDGWHAMARVERELANSLGGIWIDSRPWFCSNGRLCPSFVGSTPTKLDEAHMTPAYGQKIYPVIAESFREAGIL